MAAGAAGAADAAHARVELAAGREGVCNLQQVRGFEDGLARAQLLQRGPDVTDAGQGDSGAFVQQVPQLGDRQVVRRAGRMKAARGGLGAGRHDASLSVADIEVPFYGRGVVWGTGRQQEF